MTVAGSTTNMRQAMRALLALAIAGVALVPGATDGFAKRATQAKAARAGAAPSSGVQTAHHLALEGRVLDFHTQVERIAVKRGEARGEVGIIAYTRDSTDTRTRPVTFVIGGGPGTSSAFLHLGALAPWMIAFSASPSTPRETHLNPLTWLDFTDLVFVDPPGVGQGRLLGETKSAREHIWSVEGDIAILSDAIAQWLDRHKRLASPKVVLGQSYGGFRAPRITEYLRTQHSIALNGIMLVSPVLDYGWRYQARTSPLPLATLLPSFAAARMQAGGGKIADAEIAETETYAAGAFIADYLKGPGDVTAVERMVRRVTTITGLPAEVVRAAHGRIDETIYAREIQRDKAKVVSTYDSAIASNDPDVSATKPSFADPFLAAWRAPMARAMSALLRGPLAQRDGAYNVAGEDVFDRWDWGRDGGLPQSVGALRRSLALDPMFKVMVAHGYEDLQTPYFESKLILDQFGDVLGQNVSRYTYPGGHMFYHRDDARAAFRAEAEKFFAQLLTPRPKPGENKAAPKHPAKPGTK